MTLSGLHVEAYGDKVSSILVSKTQGIGIELTFPTVEGLPEPKTAVPLQLKCHALPGMGASPPPSSQIVSDVNFAACAIYRA